MSQNKSHLDLLLVGKLLVIGGLVMAQNLPAMFVNTLVPALMRDLGLPLDMFYVFTLAGLPIWLKWLWAPMVDRTGSARFGMRKSWLLPTTFLGVCVYASLGLVDPSIDAIWIIVGILALKTLVMSFQDVAVDGYTVENLARGERGYGAAATQMAGILGTLGASAGLMALYEVWGWTPTMLLASVLLLVFSLPALIRQEPPPAPEKEYRLRRVRDESVWRSTMTAFGHFLRRRESKLVITVIFAIGALEGFYQTLFGAFLVDGGLSFADIGMVFGVGLTVGGLAGSVVASWFLGRYGVKSALILAAFGMVTGLALIVALTLREELTFGWTLVTIGATVFLSMPLAITFSACRFRWASKAQAGTDYTIQSALYLGSKGLGGAAKGAYRVVDAG